MRELVVKVKWPPNPMVLSSLSRSTGASLTFGAAVLQDGKFIEMSSLAQPGENFQFPSFDSGHLKF